MVWKTYYWHSSPVSRVGLDGLCESFGNRRVEGHEVLRVVGRSGQIFFFFLFAARKP